MSKQDMADITVDTQRHERELKERQHIVEQCPIDVYSASINPRYGYPNKLMSYWKARGSVRDSAERVIIDSGYKRYGVMNDILEAAERHEAEWFIPPDITPHFYAYDEISAESRARELARHLKTYERWVDSKPSTHSLTRDTGVLLPVHRPIEENLEWLSNPDALKTSEGARNRWKQFKKYDEDAGLLDIYDGVAIGLKSMPVEKRIEALDTLDRNLPEETHVHALSPGTEMEMLAYLRENPHILDSLDISTPEQAPKNNKVPDETWTQQTAAFPSGDDVTTLRAMRSLEIVLRLNYTLSPLCNESEFDEVREMNTQPAHGD